MTILIGIMAGLSYPAVSGLRQSGLDQQAIGVAQTLNQAQQTYNLRVSAAETAWESAADSAAKYQLISTYVPYATVNFSDYEPNGYTITLGGTLVTKVQLSGPNGPISY